MQPCGSLAAGVAGGRVHLPVDGFAIVKNVHRQWQGSRGGGAAQGEYLSPTHNTELCAGVVEMGQCIPNMHNETRSSHRDRKHEIMSTNSSMPRK